MSRYALRVHAVLICLGICLPAAIGRAADSNPADNVASGPSGSQGRDGGDQPVTSPESVVRRPVSHSIAPWADPPHDSSVAPRPRRLTRPVPNQAFDDSAQPAAPASRGFTPATVPPNAAPSRPRRDVRLAAHATVDADQPPPEVPPTNSLPAPMNPMNPMSPMKRYMSPPMASGEMGGPSCACDRPGYWIPDYEFPMMGNWIGGAEFLLVRPHVTRDSAFEITPNGGGGADTQNVNFNAPYEAALRAFIGWQINCDQSLRFTYTYIFDDKSRSADVPDGSVITSPIGASLNPGDSIKATQHLRLQTWDIDNVRKLELPGMGCDTCSAWEAKWSWGVRIIDVEETILNDVTGPDAESLTQKSSFAGAGPRIGFELRRQLCQTRLLGFVGADAGLLLGGQTTAGSNTPSGFNSAQIVPDFDLRVGVCWQPRPEIAISTGWMFETFGDAIMLNQDASLATLSRPQASSLSYDGLFVRGEFHF